MQRGRAICGCVNQRRRQTPVYGNARASFARAGNIIKQQVSVAAAAVAVRRSNTDQQHQRRSKRTGGNRTTLYPARKHKSTQDRTIRAFIPAILLNSSLRHCDSTFLFRDLEVFGFT